MKKIKASKELINFIALAMDGFSCALAIKADFGVTPMNVFSLVMKDLFPKLSVGTMNFIIQVVVLLLTMIVMNRYTFSYIFCFVPAFIYDVFIDIFVYLFRNITCVGYLRILFFVLSILNVSFAIYLYMRCSLPLMPLDVIVRDFSDKFNKREGTMKLIIDACFLSSGLIISLIKFNEIRHVGIATLIFCICIGNFTNLFAKIFDKRINYQMTTRIGQNIQKLTKQS